jgi:hypothetical protein
MDETKTITKTDIICKLAYARAKMLNHQSWVGKLPRGAKPSDMDMFLTNDLNFLWFELSSWTANWHRFKNEKNRRHWSQWKSHHDLVEGGKGLHRSILVHNSIPLDPEQEIDSLNDIIEFSPMLWKRNQVIEGPILNGKDLLEFCNMFMRNEV